MLVSRSTKLDRYTLEVFVPCFHGLPSSWFDEHKTILELCVNLTMKKANHGNMKINISNVYLS